MLDSEGTPTMAWSEDDQPYNIILAGAFGVGKSSLFRQLSREVHGDHVYTTITTTRGQQLQPGETTTSSPQHLDKWTHSALVLGDTVKVSYCWKSYLL